MPDPRNIPYVLDLLDDDSQPVKEEVVATLKGFGMEMGRQTAPYISDLERSKRQELLRIWSDLRQEIFAERWLDWIKEPDPRLALESALTRLAFLEADLGDEPLPTLLDALSEECAESGPSDLGRLMDFLFIEKGFGPPKKEDFYHPDNSNLVSVIQRRAGLQISLSCIAMLTGYRLGIELHGLNLPGHFMILAVGRERLVVFDPFQQGRPLPDSTMRHLESNLERQQSSIWNLRARTHEIVIRVLRNLINAHTQYENGEGVIRYKEILERTIQAFKDRQL